MNILFNKLLHWEPFFLSMRKQLTRRVVSDSDPLESGGLLSDLGKPVRFTQVPPV